MGGGGRKGRKAWRFRCWAKSAVLGITALEASGPLDVPRDSANRYKSTIQSRLISLRQRWMQSLLRIVASEIGNLPRRMAAILRAPSLRYGPEIPRGMLDQSAESFCQENKFQRACTASMGQLRSENRWAGYLEIQMAAVSFQRGAQWGYRNSCSQTGNGESSSSSSAKSISCVAYPESGEGLDTSSLPMSKPRILRLRIRRCYLYSVLQALLEDCRSLICRMRFSIEIRACWHSVDTGLVPPGLERFSVPDIYRRVYMQDMQRLQDEYPFLTYGDRLIMTQLWLAVSKSCLHNSCSSHSGSRIRSLDHPESGNFMPPLAVPQDSKRDRSTLLPSQE
jgi:hypothetical protein